MTVEEVIDEEGEDHDPTCDLFDRLNALKNDEELMDLATGFVLQLLRSAQDEALRRGHVPSKVFRYFFVVVFFLFTFHSVGLIASILVFLFCRCIFYASRVLASDGAEEQNESRVAT